MKTRKLRINKKRLGAIILAIGFTIGGFTLTKSLISQSKGEEVSQVQQIEAPYTFYYTAGDLVFISNGHNIGYIPISNIDLSSLNMPNYNVEFTDMYVNTDNAGIYLLPGFENECKHLLKRGDRVTLNAYGDDGWSVVNYYDDNDELKIGFVHSSFLDRTNPLIEENVKEPIEETNNQIKVAVISGKNVNVRSSGDTTNRNNIIGSCNTGDKFEIIDHIGDWYLVNYYGEEGFIYYQYVNEDYMERKVYETEIPASEVLVAKITGNNVNVRSSMSSKNSDNIIGFCDITDKFEIIDHDDEWYHIKYLNKEGYVSAKYVTEQYIDQRELNIKKMVYIPSVSAFCDENGNALCYLPANQNLLVIGEHNTYYKVIVDGVVGYVKKKETKSLTNTCIVVDLSRQILKVYKNGIEVFRCYVITGAKSSQTYTGCFKIGHHMEGYTFPSSGIYNEYWMQFDGNRGIHPADANAGKGWQKKKYFEDAAKKAYENWAQGRGVTYPNAHGSHGCVNTMIADTEVIFSLCGVGDNVLVIEQSGIMNCNLLSYNNNYQVMWTAFNDNTGIHDAEWRSYAYNTVDYDYPKTKKLV